MYDSYCTGYAKTVIVDETSEPEGVENFYEPHPNGVPYFHASFAADGKVVLDQLDKFGELDPETEKWTFHVNAHVRQRKGFLMVDLRKVSSVHIIQSSGDPDLIKQYTHNIYSLPLTTDPVDEKDCLPTVRVDYYRKITDPHPSDNKVETNIGDQNAEDDKLSKQILKEVKQEPVAADDETRPPAVIIVHDEIGSENGQPSEASEAEIKEMITTAMAEERQLVDNTQMDEEMQTDYTDAPQVHHLHKLLDNSHRERNRISQDHRSLRRQREAIIIKIVKLEPFECLYRRHDCYETVRYDVQLKPRHEEQLKEYVVRAAWFNSVHKPLRNQRNFTIYLGGTKLVYGPVATIVSPLGSPLAMRQPLFDFTR